MGAGWLQETSTVADCSSESVWGLQPLETLFPVEVAGAVAPVHMHWLTAVHVHCRLAVVAVHCELEL